MTADQDLETFTAAREDIAAIANVQTHLAHKFAVLATLVNKRNREIAVVTAERDQSRQDLAALCTDDVNRMIITLVEERDQLRKDLYAMTGERVFLADLLAAHIEDIARDHGGSPTVILREMCEAS